MTRTARTWERRPIWIGLAVMLCIASAVEAVVLFGIIDDQHAVGADLAYYQGVAQRWLDTGVYYTARQLSGSYEVKTLVDNLYPPQALYLFLPFLVLPSILWWILPLGFIGYVVWWCRPAAWALPLLAVCVLFPKTPTQILYGNSDMWIAAFIAGGVRWAGPAVLVSIKPSLGMFGLLGIRSRHWWIAALVLALASLPFLGLWLQYPTAMRNSSAGWSYSFGNLPFFVLPVLAWIWSTRRPAGRSIRSWTIQLLGAERA